MARFGKKVYGESQTEACVFCGAQSYKRNKLGLPLCKEHQNEEYAPAFKCICGDWIDVLNGKYGPYAKCLRCGIQKLDKIREHNSMLNQKKQGKDSNLCGNKYDGYFKIQKKSGEVKKADVTKIKDSKEVDAAMKSDPDARSTLEYQYGVFLDDE